jgi:hypothetical protein
MPEPPDMPCVSDNGASAPISALTNAFSLSSIRGHSADEFGPKIIARLADIEQKSAHLRQRMNWVRQVIEPMCTGIANGSNRLRTLLDQDSVKANSIRFTPTQESNQIR